MSAMPSAAPYQIRCAEIWGGTAAKQDAIATPGIRAAIHSSASGDGHGGDIYYLSVCGYETLTRIALADLRGHGETVSRLSHWIYDELAERMNDTDGAAVLTDLSEVVRSRGLEAITTAVVATFDRDRGVLYHANAGHPPMWLSKAAGGWQKLQTRTTAGPANLPLGALPNTRYTQEQVRIEPGDRLLLLTDGVLETPGATPPANDNDGDSLYGEQRLLDVLQRTRQLPLDEARQVLRDDLTHYAGGELLHDDCTFLLIEPFAPAPFWKRRLWPQRQPAPDAARQ
jgi:phosphoserine phosphatase RsbU/P